MGILRDDRITNKIIYLRINANGFSKIQVAGMTTDSHSRPARASGVEAYSSSALVRCSSASTSFSMLASCSGEKLLSASLSCCSLI